MKPHIDREAMKAITVKVGQNIDFDVPVRGEPPPDLVWTHSGKTLQSENKIRILNEDYRTQFSLKGIVRKEAGKYTLTATNSSGTDHYDVEVTVLGKRSISLLSNNL